MCVCVYIYIYLYIYIYIYICIWRDGKIDTFIYLYSYTSITKHACSTYPCVLRPQARPAGGGRRGPSAGKRASMGRRARG